MSEQDDFSNFKHNALNFARRSYPVFPCISKGKMPLTKHGFKDAVTDESVIAEWWSRWPDANIGIITGQRSGFWVLDIDGEEGEESLRALEKEHGELLHNIEVITGGGGRHIYFQWPQHGGISNNAGKLGAGLDVRGNGGYVIAPPSLHESGRRYVWSVDSGNQLQHAPPWLLELIRQPAAQSKVTPVTEWRQLAKGVGEGQRNDALARLAGKLLRCGIDPHMALDLCHAWNESRCTPPLPADEVFKTVNSIAGRELARRGRT